MTNNLIPAVDLVGKIVEVETGDVVYIGKLIEVGENEVHIEAKSRWVAIPVDMIAYIREKTD